MNFSFNVMAGTIADNVKRRHGTWTWSSPWNLQRKWNPRRLFGTYPHEHPPTWTFMSRKILSSHFLPHRIRMKLGYQKMCFPFEFFFHWMNKKFFSVSAVGEFLNEKFYYIRYRLNLAFINFLKLVIGTATVHLVGVFSHKLVVFWKLSRLYQIHNHSTPAPQSSAFKTTPMAILSPFEKASSWVQQLCVKAKLNSTTKLPILQKCLQKRLNFQQTQITHVSHNVRTVTDRWLETLNFRTKPYDSRFHLSYRKCLDPFYH